MNRLKVLCVAAVTTAMLTACQTTSESGGTYTVPVRILRHFQGNDAAFNQIGEHLINTPRQLAAAGSKTLEGLDVDFARQSLLVVALGQCPTGGYAAQISGVQKRGDELFVQGTAYRPRKEDPVTQALSYPIAAAVIEKVHARWIHPEIDDAQGPAAAAGKGKATGPDH